MYFWNFKENRPKSDRSGPYDKSQSDASGDAEKMEGSPRNMTESSKDFANNDKSDNCAAPTLPIT